MKSFTVFHILGSTIALLGSPGVQAAANSEQIFAAVTSTLTAFGTRISTSPAISSPSTTSIISAAVAVNISQNQVSASVTLLSRTEVNIPIPSVGILSASALDSDNAVTPLSPTSNHSSLPSPTSSASSKQTGSSSHQGIFISLLSSVHSTFVLPVNSLSIIPPKTFLNTATTISQLRNPAQKAGLATANSDIDELTISSWPAVFTTIYSTMAHTFTVTASLQLSDPSHSNRNNATAPSVSNLLATAPSLKEKTTLTRILSTGGNVVAVLSFTSSLSPPAVQSLSTLSSNLPASYESTYTKYLTVPSTTIFSTRLSSNLPPSDSSTSTKFFNVPSATKTLQSIPTTTVALNISAPQSPSSSSLSSSSPIPIFRGIFRNILPSSARAEADDSPPPPPPSPPSNNNNNNKSSSVAPNKRRRIIVSVEDDVVSSSSSGSHITNVPALPLINVLRTKGLLFSTKTTKKMDYSDDDDDNNNSKK